MLRSLARTSGDRTTISLWRLKRSGSSVTCVLRQTSDDVFVLSVTIDGSDIARRRYRTRAAAIDDAGFLLERLAAEGWTLVVGLAEMTIH